MDPATPGGTRKTQISGNSTRDAGSQSFSRASLCRVTVPAVVYVSGAPGAGKSTVAVPLAEQLGLPLLSKDIVKEQLFDSLPRCSDDPMIWSRVLGGAAMELLWTLARQASTVVLEANFRPHSDLERSRLEGLRRPLVEVHCSCPAELAASRFADRARSPSRREEVHPLTAVSPELLAEFDMPMGLGQLVVVDTTQAVDVQAIAAQVNSALRNLSETQSRG